MAENASVIFRVDVEALSSITDVLRNIMEIYGDATQTGASYQAVSVTGSDDVSNRLQEFYAEAKKGEDKFGEEIEAMITTLETITTAYKTVESNISSALAPSSTDQ